MSDPPSVAGRHSPSHCGIRAARIVLPCPELEPTLSFFVLRLGFAVESIFPADHPRAAVVVGHGVRLSLEPGAGPPPGRLVLRCDDPGAVAGGETELVAPNGTRVTLEPAEPPLALPPLRPSLVVTRADAAAWVTGRAGMMYRDLVPDRQGGRFVASQIRIPQGGPVPDYVHHHHVRLQLLYCHRGWVKVVYEDQGPPRVFEPGDAVLQPPHIRHQVLECSPGLEVIELTSPAEHHTLTDFALRLPTGRVRPEREFGGQRFVHHRATEARWGPWRRPGWSSRALGIAAATGGLASARVARPVEPRAARTAPLEAHADELRLCYVLAGSVTLALADRAEPPLEADDCVVVPPGLPHALVDPSPELRLLEISVPAHADPGSDSSARPMASSSSSSAGGGSRRSSTATGTSQ